MELSSTILKVLAVQLGDAASTRQMPPAYHHRDALTSCSLSAGCTLQVAGDRRPPLLDVMLMPAVRLCGNIFVGTSSKSEFLLFFALQINSLKLKSSPGAMPAIIFI